MAFTLSGLINSGGQAVNTGGGQSNPNSKYINLPLGYSLGTSQGGESTIQAGPELEAEFKKRLAFNDTLRQQEQGLYSSLTGALGGLSGSSTSNPVSITSGLPATIQYPGAPDFGVDKAAAAEQSAAFGKAKAQAGAMGTSAVNSLRAELADRGILGSGVEARGLVDRLAAATNPLSDINAQQLHENTGIAQHNQDLAAQAAANSYQGAIAQRGQDIGAQTQIATANANLAAQKQQALYALLGKAVGGLNFNVSY